MTTPVQRADLERVAQKVAQLIGPAFARAGLLFTVLGFAPGPDPWATYVSNACRADMVRALREMADTLELEADEPPMDGGPGIPKSGGKSA